MNINKINQKQKVWVLIVSTIAFTACFAVWTVFSIIGIKIKQDLGLNDAEFGLLVATPILTGSISRIFLGIWTDQYGGRKVFTIVMLLASLGAYLLTTVTSFYSILACALLLGLAGGGFAVGIAYVSSWFEAEKQGTVLGIFGMGNVGAAVTSFGAPFLLIAHGWHFVAQVYAIIFVVVAILFFILTKEDPRQQERKKTKQKPVGIIKQLEPLKHLQVWRFSLYYFFVFGAFVALALWLPIYYVNVYGLSLASAGMLTALYALPGSIFRALGGILSDKFGARTVMYFTFIACVICTFILSYPSTDYIIHGVGGDINFSFSIGLIPFVCTTIVLGFFMSLGKAAVYKHIPVYYPSHVGSVGGMVGMIGGLGGFCLPIAFGILNDQIGVWTSCFMLLTIIITISLIWMHFAILQMNKKQGLHKNTNKYLPELEIIKQKK